MISGEGRVMGLDVGEVRTGIALTDPLQMMASPHTVLQVKSPEADAAAIAALVQEQEVVGIVAGVPLDQNGAPGPQAEKVLAFLAVLREAVSVDVVTQDERFSTAAADRSLREAGIKGKKRKLHVDKIAATHILQGWLDRRDFARRNSE